MHVRRHTGTETERQRERFMERVPYGRVIYAIIYCLSSDRGQIERERKQTLPTKGIVSE